MRHFRFLTRHKGLLLIILVSGLGSSFLSGLGISFILPLLSDVETGGQSSIPFPFNIILGAFSGMNLSQRLQIIAALIVLVTFTKGLLLYANVISTTRLMIITVKRFRMLCFDQLMKMGIGYFNKQNIGNLHTKCVIYPHAIGCSVNAVGIAIPRFFNILIYLGLALLLSWKMTIISILFAALSSLVLRGVMEKSESAGKSFTKDTELLNTTSIEMIMAMKTIRMFRREKETMDDIIEKRIDKLNKSLFRLFKLRGIVTPIFEITGMICLAIIMIAGSIFFFKYDHLGLSGLVVFLVIFQRISGDVMALNHVRVMVKGDLPSYREVFDFIDPHDKEYLKDGNKVFSGHKEYIEFKGVGFSYNAESPEVLSDVSFRIPKGSKVGVVGPSGAGKSTLAELLMRFYDPKKGQILVDGLDLRDLVIGSWRRNIGVVSQEIFLFNDTIRTNIAYAKPDATQDEIDTAAYKAYAYDFIHKLPQGYESVIGDRGVLLSGGERQRIAIARAVITNPEILIFDEATSSLDTESERIVQKALDQISEGRTVVTIAHRLSTVFDSDLILVFDSGRVAEKGTHKELLEKGGLYRKLIQMQELDEKNLGKEMQMASLTISLS